MRRWVSSRTESKYRSVKTVVDGITFHSKREAARYRDLLLLQHAGQIRKLELQPKFQLHANGILLGEYLGDFRYEISNTGNFVTEDVKGMAGLPLYRWKVKHVKAEYGVDVQEVR